MSAPSAKLRVLLAIVLATLVGGSLVGAVAWRFGNEVLRQFDSSVPSRSVGSRGEGRLVNGKRMPTEGWNYATYSYLGSLVGRTAVNDRVRDTLLDAYAELAQTHPEVVWIYGETAWPSGGDFWPHRTHQHGLSVDHMVPVRTGAGTSSRLPCRAWNGLGYGLHADADGRFSGELHTDFAALAALIDAVDRHAAHHGLGLRLVIYAPDLQDDLARAGGGSLWRRTRFSQRASWVRHDNHVHMDFVVR